MKFRFSEMEFVVFSENDMRKNEPKVTVKIKYFKKLDKRSVFAQKLVRPRPHQPDSF